MNTKTLKDVREEKGISQQALAEKMHVPVATIRKWENREATPALMYLDALSSHLGVSKEDVIKMFKPEETKVHSDREIENELAEEFNDLMQRVDSSESLFPIIWLFGRSSSCRGIVTDGERVFTFSRILTDHDIHTCHSAILIDRNNNRIVLTENNILEVSPAKEYYDNFTFLVDVNYPVFPINEDYDPDDFSQNIRITFFSEI